MSRDPGCSRCLLFATCAHLFFLLPPLRTPAFAVSVVPESAEDETELPMLQKSKKSGTISKMSGELKEIVFVIQSQSNSFHSKRAEDLKRDILKQSADLGKQ